MRSAPWSGIAVSVAFAARSKVKRWRYTSRTEVSANHSRQAQPTPHHGGGFVSDTYVCQDIAHFLRKLCWAHGNHRLTFRRASRFNTFWPPGCAALIET